MIINSMGKLVSPSDDCQRYIINVTTKKVHWRLKRGIIDFKESLTEARWGVKKMNLIRDYMSEVIINVTKRTPRGFGRKRIIP